MPMSGAIYGQESNTMAFDVFISYSSKNNVIATAACAAIEATGAHCWMAPRNIRPGRTYGEAIIDGMNECRILALIYSAYSNASPQVLREVERAVSKGLEVITVRVEDVPMSKALEYFLAAGHWLDGVGNDTEAALSQLGSAVRLGLDHPDAHGEFLTAPTAVDTPVKIAAVPKAPITNLPAALTSFVGRATEKTDISEALVRSRMVTVTGPGGCGKSRVALEVAGDNVDHYPGGIWYVDIDRISVNVLQAIFDVMHIAEEVGTDMSPIEAALDGKPALLVLDNCDSEWDSLPNYLPLLLKSCQSVKILATNRSPLGIAGENAWPLAPFAPIDVDKLPRGGEALVAALDGNDSVQLFVDRAKSVVPSFELSEANAAHVVAICNRLDGVPLAIELAAARAKVLSPEQISARLSDQFRLLGGNKGGPERQQTLRATLDWSYNLLSENERILLQRLSVFEGPCPMEAVEAICTGDPIDDFDILDLLTGLVDKSLVLADEWDGSYRYRQLQSVREYAQEKAGIGSNLEFLPDVRDRHLAYYLAVVEKAEPNLSGQYQAAWLDRLDDDRANWVAALSWARTKAVEGAPLQLELRFVTAVSRFWMLRGDFDRAWPFLNDACHAAQLYEDRSPTYAKALNAAGSVAWSQGNIEVARDHFERSLALYRELGDAQRTADLLNNLGNLALDEGDEEKAGALLEEALASYRAANDQPGISAALGNLALIALRAEDLTRAKSMYHESLTIDHSMGDSWAIATSLHALGVIACRTGEPDQAKSHLEDSLARRVELGDHAGIAECIEAFGELALSNGHFERALKLWGAASAIRESTGSTMPAADAALHEGRIKKAATEVGESTHTRCWNEGRMWSTDEAVRHARA